MANDNFSITIAPALQISTTSLPNDSPSVSYSATLGATGRFPPYAWTITQGGLPSGLTLNATSGVISGTPTGVGTSTFTVQASDSGSPAATATASLSIVITPPPPRSAALYVDQAKGPAGNQWDQTGLQIHSDGSLTLLPSLPEAAITGSAFSSSSTLPLLFFVESGPPSYLKSLLVNPDYSLTAYSSSGPLAGSPTGYGPSVDPTGSNVYLPGPIDSSGATGVTIFPGDGSFQALGTVAIPEEFISSHLVFTPAGTLAFIQTCSTPNQGSIISLTRASNGMLTTSALYGTSGCVGVMAVSPDGKYLATGDGGEAQVYSIASDGTLTAVLSQPFAVVLDSQGDPTSVADMTWDQSTAFLLVSTAGTLNNAPPILYGGVAVLSFSGNTLTETVYPTGSQGVGTGRILRVGSRFYAMKECARVTFCIAPYGIVGLDFQNGQLIPLPGSPYPYGNGSDIVIY